MNHPCLKLRRLAPALLGSVALVCSLATLQSPAQDHPLQRSQGADPKINAQFKKPDVKQFKSRFESNERESYAKRKEILQALNLKPGDRVADVGAGTGFFSQLFAETVGPQGKVYAEDVAANFLEHIKTEAKKKGLTQLVTVQGSQESVKLPPNSVDLVFMNDVYHHLENPRAVLASIHQALAPGGRLVVIDFDRVEGKSKSFVLKHVRASQQVFRGEIESAGFRRLPTPDAPRLKENFFLMFRKVEAPGRAGESRK